MMLATYCSLNYLIVLSIQVGSTCCKQFYDGDVSTAAGVMQWCHASAMLAPAIINECSFVEQVLHDFNEAVIGCLVDWQPATVVARIHWMSLV